MIRTIVTLVGLLSQVPVLGQENWIEGTSQPAERITISSPVEEIVETVPVKEGQVVEAGAVLATLFSTREGLEVKRLSLMIDKAAEDLKTAQKLFGKKIQSKSNLLEKELELKRLKVEREMAQFSVDQRVIKAPVAGTVVYRLKDPGEAIGRVEPLFEIIDASKMKLVFFLSTSHLGQIKEGMEVEVAFPALPKVTGKKAKLVFIDPQLDSRSGLFRVRFEFDNSEVKIKPGMRVKVKLPAPSESK
ncbi:efflux RND transporter periplasmic adaptor subunit [Akkermansiaceae bacterium]|nr:efflux RND transporter periplasmic adaptor subunit [Akkermansiaceae bacterium]MDB4369535.1 efflux RND transporter periplasmic adaptor subunit [Akkermansiaceae bacterium]MDB4408603.1 efflux RND transporter periplasmic adaptor subunit [Akkermansiaceae bacterium]